ncbi:hypothetical protein Clacol_002229 [Clathrus columnatus]|uniref:Uncharacterized protein n=1 Tax=Clathrus columnatus TaxID=1419009 RepID=A0AAV5A3K4_9AGAM|nr:hypothetical protein Clacol_002229 [Clathrus columnatus]
MSAAIKRLSTIIRPHPHTSGASPQKESPKTESNPIDAPAKPDTSMISKDSTSTPAATAAPTTTESTMTEMQPAPATEPVASTEQPKEAQTMETTTNETPVTAAAPAETVQEMAATEEKPPVDSSTTPVTAEASDTPKKTETKQDATSVKEKSSRRTRDIGRDTIRRFSTILRSGNGHQQPKDKESVPPVPTVPAKDETPASTAVETKPASAETTASTTTATAVTTPAPVEKLKTAPDSKPVKAATKTKETEKPKAAARRGSSFFSAARDVVRGPQRNKSKSLTKTEVAAVAPKKSSAKGKRVVVVTGASKGVGLEFVKQYATQTDTFVIALSRTIDRSSDIRALVKDSSKSGHVRPIRVDIGNPKSVASAVKEIVEITDGRIDLLIHAAGAKADPSLRMGDIKGPELEEDLRYNLVGPIALTNALLPYLKPRPPPEVPVEEAKPAATNDEVKKEEPTKNEETEAKNEETRAEITAVDANKEISPPGAKVEATPTEVTPALAATEEPPMEGTVEPSAPAVESTPLTSEKIDESTTLDAKATDAAPVPEPSTSSDAAKPVEATEAAPMQAEEMTPAPTPKPVYFPPTPYIIFLTPADSIVNERGIIPMGSAFIATPRTLFSLSRSSLQVAIAQYGMSLGRQAGVVGIERGGALDPYANISDADAVKGVMEFLPTITINQSGRLLRV